MKVKLDKYINEVNIRNKNNIYNDVYSVTNSEGFVESKEYFSKEVFSKDLSNYKIVMRNMMAYNPSRINVGSVAIQNKKETVIVSPLYIIFSVNQEYLLVEYLNYFLHSDIGLNQIKFLTSGSVRDNLNFSSLKNLLMPIEDIHIQKKRIEILRKLDSLISLKKFYIDKLNKLISSLFIEMFGDPWINNKNYTIDKLKNYCILNPSKEKNIKKDELCSFIEMASITENGDINTNNIKKFLEVNKGFTYFLENDVLFAKITPCMENGKGAIAQNLCNGIGAGSTEFHVLRPLTNKSNPYWLYILTTLKHFRVLAEKNMTGSAGQRRVPISFFEKFQLPIPPIDVQENFAKKVSQIDKSKFTNSYITLIFIQNSMINTFFS